MHPKNSVHDTACGIGGPELLLQRKKLGYAIPLTFLSAVQSD
jgi:hypothetical protein